MKKITIGIVALATLAIFALTGCMSASDNIFRLEQTSVNLVHAGYVGYTNALPQLHIDEATSNKVRELRLDFGATALTLDDLNAAYKTNSALKPQVNAVLDTLTSKSTNLVWLYNFIKLNGKAP